LGAAVLQETRTLFVPLIVALAGAGAPGTPAAVADGLTTTAMAVTSAPVISQTPGFRGRDVALFARCLGMGWGMVVLLLSSPVTWPQGRLRT
jgi:hypothetical protein